MVYGYIRQYSIFISILFLIGLPGCGPKRLYPSKPLKPLQSYIDYHETIEDITVQAKKLNAQECVRTFGEPGKCLLRGKKSIQPIQLSITNYSNELIILKPKNIDLNLLDYRQVAQRLQSSPGWRALGVATAGILITAAVATGGLSALVLGHLFASLPLFAVGASLVAASPFLLLVGTPIASTVKSSQVNKENSLIKKCIKEKTLANVIIIEPNQTENLVIFVQKKQLKPSFEMILIERRHPHEKVIFTIRLDNPDKAEYLYE